MKSTICLSSIALASLLNVSPLFALSQSSSESSLSSYSEKSGLVDRNDSSKGEIGSSDGLIANGLFGSINQVLRDQQRAAEREKLRQDRLERDRVRAEERKEREERAAIGRKERQAKADAARKEAGEKQRIEADRRYQYFQSLSPEAKEAYVAEQRAIQQRNNEMAARLFGMIIESALTPRVCRRGSWFSGYTYYDC